MSNSKHSTTKTPATPKELTKKLPKRDTNRDYKELMDGLQEYRESHQATLQAFQVHYSND